MLRVFLKKKLFELELIKLICTVFRSEIKTISSTNELDGGGVPQTNFAHATFLKFAKFYNGKTKMNKKDITMTVADKLIFPPDHKNSLACGHTMVGIDEKKQKGYAKDTYVDCYRRLDTVMCEFEVK